MNGSGGITGMAPLNPAEMSVRIRPAAIISPDVDALEWLHLHRAEQDDEITTLGRRWLTRAIWHIEEDVEAHLRAK